MNPKNPFTEAADLFSSAIWQRCRTLSGLSRGIVAGALSCAALALRLAILPLDGGAPFVTFYPVVIVSCLFLGAAPGLLTLGLSTVATEYFFLAPHGSFRLQGEQIIPLCIFALSGGLICYLSHLAGRYAEQLRESETRYRSVLEDQTEVICRFKADGTFIFANEVYCRLFGRPTSELIGTKWQPIAYAADIPEVEAKLRTLSRQNPVVTVENRVYSGSGELKWMQFVNRAFFDASGELAEIQAVGRDISERKAMEEKIRTSNERLQLVLDGSGDGLWDWDLQTGLAYLSPTYLALTGYKPGEITPDLNFFKSTVYPKDLPRVMQVMNAHLTGKLTTSEFDYRLVTRSGEIKWMSGRGRIVERNAAGEPTRMAGTISDISHRKHAEAALRTAQEELERRVAERTGQLRDLAVQVTVAEEKERRSIARDLHDGIGQMLHVAKIKLDDLRNAAPVELLPRVAELDGLIADTSRRIRSLTSQISPPILGDLGLIPALNWLCDDMEHTYGLDVEKRLEELPNVLTEVQASILFRAVRELLINVAKHADADTVRIELAREGDALRLSVIDDGVGCRQMPAMGVREGGFGLFSIRERITFLGGRMSLTATEGGGTRVDLSLPLACPTDTAKERSE